MTDPSIGGWQIADSLEKCGSLLDRGIGKLHKSVAKGSLLEEEAVLPLGLVALLTTKLMDDVTSGRPDILGTYFEYSKKLVS